ncbi:ABC transporter permease [Actinomadura kijaniata]|uniref:ABC transporter permease n=1 Tax=Actinomadura kijaniata TaxID=46161 RepID=UPI00082FC393|nr:ABC transporter permease [Actinomadura kijaniata]
MTATTTTPTAAVPAASLDEPTRPPLPRLVRVEIRKMVDTRSGRWLLALIALSAVAMMPVMLFAAPRHEQSLAEMVSAAQLGIALLLPVLGILSVTTEWSQRTSLATFTLVPDRHRVAAAKLAAGWALALALAAASVLVAVAGRAVGEVLNRSGGSWELAPEQLGKVALLALISVSMGVAFGMLFMNTPLAIVLYFLLPNLWSAIGAMVSKLERAAGWLDTNRTMGAIGDPGVTAGEWTRLAVSLAVWLLLPLVVGLVRLHRREVK